MTKEKVQQVIEIYRRKFQTLTIQKVAYPDEELPDSSHDALKHCHSMLDRMEGLIEANRMEKVFRWLGFIQGVLWSHKIYTLAEIKSHSRKDPE